MWATMSTISLEHQYTNLLYLQRTLGDVYYKYVERDLTSCTLPADFLVSVIVL